MAGAPPLDLTGELTVLPLPGRVSGIAPSGPSPEIFFGYFNVEIPYFRGILVLTVKLGKARQRATFDILGGMAPLPP